MDGKTEGGKNSCWLGNLKFIYFKVATVEKFWLREIFIVPRIHPQAFSSDCYDVLNRLKPPRHRRKHSTSKHVDILHHFPVRFYIILSITLHSRFVHEWAFWFERSINLEDITHIFIKGIWVTRDLKWKTCCYYKHD